MTDETQGESPVEDAPVSPETQAADSSPAPEVPAIADDAGTERPRDEEGKFISPKAQKRIDELTWKSHEAERQAEHWRQMAMAQQQPPPKAEEVKLPTLESVGYDESKYQAALIEYATKQAEQVVERRLTEAEQKRAEQARMESFATRQREFAKATPDFEDRVLRDPTLPITAAMRDVILDSPAGPELAYHLATNREQADAISRLPAHLAALEMGRIEGRLAALKEAAKRPVISKAPPPPPKVDEAEVPIANVKASDADSDKLDQEAWFKLREKELKRKKA
jgi:hypothetical protein